jgi:hypothetical protein
VTGPLDVIGSAPVGVLNEDLREACLAALRLSREDCRAFALERSWEASARAFMTNIQNAAHRLTDGPEPAAASNHISV